MRKSRKVGLVENAECMNIKPICIHANNRQMEGKNLLGISMITEEGVTKMELKNTLLIGLN